MVAQIVALAVILLAVTYLLNQNRSVNPNFPIEGIPYVLPMVAVLLILWTFMLGRTTFGRHVYAVGGNAEAARRAGINVDRIRILGVHHLLRPWRRSAASSRRPTAARSSTSSGGGNVLLYAVGAAVIGGTSLFGGKGKARDAVIGGLVIATIANGLGLLNQASYINFLVTGGVLLLAASVDAISRRRRSATGTVEPESGRPSGKRDQPGGRSAAQPRHPPAARAPGAADLSCRADLPDGAEPQHHRWSGRRAGVARCSRSRQTRRRYAHGAGRPSTEVRITTTGPYVHGCRRRAWDG